MTYIPIFPHVPITESNDTDRRDLFTAIRLLSGHECVRDAQSAQKILVGLTQSNHQDVADVSRAIMQTGGKEGWFEMTIPNYLTLSIIAEHALKNDNRGISAERMRLKLALLGGLVTFGLGVFFYFQVSGSASISWIMIFLIVGVLVATMLPLLLKRDT